MRKVLSVLLVVLCLSLAGVMVGCGGGSASSSGSAVGSEGSGGGSGSSMTSQGVDLPDGTYSAAFKTDSSMFHVNEASDGRGELVVDDGEATIHVSLVSKRIVNLYAGLAEEAQADGADIIEPTVDNVTYSDGYQEEVYGFDIPVPALDEEFDVAILGESGKWYDHKVSVSDPVEQ